MTEDHINDPANALIVALVTASNQVESLEPEDVRNILDLAITLIGQLRAGRDGARNEIADLEAISGNAGGFSPEDWQDALRRAADILRTLQSDINPRPALPTHVPDGGDGGNY